MSSSFSWRLRAALALATLASAAQAQNAQQLDTVIVTGNPLRSDEPAQPASVLAGDGLVLRRGSSLAETLADQPGVSTSWFGPNANRPMLRGLDGERVRVLSNASASFDASTLSNDHAVPIDPLAVERIEVLRGPAALLYGGSAIGGVVNAIDNRIPKTALTQPGGAAEVRLGGAARERGGAALVETGDGRWALHADAFARETDDLRVPGGRVDNSGSRARGGALGASYVFGSGHVGLALDRYENRYGIVVEPDVTVDMKRDHLALEGEWRELPGVLESVRARFGRTVYEHQEIEDGEVGTTFATRGSEARVEATHAPLGTLRGVLGAQWERSDFSALGEEAFVPSTLTRRAAAFVFEETPWPLGTLSFGARAERVQVALADDSTPARRFTLASGSIANLWKFAPNWSFTASLAHSERAPTSFELYADGVHVATAAYERGDPGLRTERGRNIDAALRWSDGASEARLGVFDARFSRYVTLAASGAVVEDLPEYEFRATRARLRGIEAQARHRIAADAWAFDLDAQLDLVRGDDLARNEPLARIAPARLRLGVQALHGPWTLAAALTGVQRQSRVPATDTATPGYTLLDLSAAHRFDWGLAFVKLGNVGNVLARNAASIATVRDLAPLPGRALSAGLRVNF
ncbi:TonB-dependent receptor [Piscinibacter sp.]|uniref:TonB-dependent receptor n=1 Tax=Piscinibacter sp. TaxID=1903157 RepID=UPI0039E2B1A0